MSFEFIKRLKIFDLQIKKEYEEAEGVKEKCISYWGKILFIKTKDFTIDDWRKIRDDEYYDKIKDLTDIERSIFILKNVEDYIKKQEQ